MEQYAHRLEERGIKVTAVRLLIFRAMDSHPQAFSMADLERKLDTVDKSTLSRTINLFHNHKLIHSIDDGSGSAKYSLCREDCNCDLQDLHAHFYCYECKHTFCLDGVPIPKVRIPKGFVPESENFVIKGTCQECSASATRLH